MIKQTQFQPIHNENLVSLGKMVAEVAHEINNPLAFIGNNILICEQAFIGLNTIVEAYQSLKPKLERDHRLQYIEELEEELDIDCLREDIPRLYKAMQEGLERIRKIVLNLENFSQLEEKTTKNANLIEGLESCITLLNYQFQNRIVVEKQFNAIPLITCNPGKLNQVFMNIISNAIQSISDKGKIVIQTSFENNTISIRISDSGTGIPESIINRIFEPFFTTKQVGEGTGLGLSISLGIVKEHNGQIFYSNNAEKGATCTITLPIK